MSESKDVRDDISLRKLVKISLGITALLLITLLVLTSTFTYMMLTIKRKESETCKTSVCVMLAGRKLTYLSLHTYLFFDSHFILV